MTVFSPARQAASPFRSWRSDHSGLRVADLEAAAAWYRDTMDFRVANRMEFGKMVFVLLRLPDDDDFGIELLAGPGAENRPAWADIGDSLELAGWHHVCFGVENVDEAVAELKRRGVKIVIEPMDVDAICRRIAFFSDPWGNLFELTEPAGG